MPKAQQISEIVHFLETHLASLYIDEDELTRDQVILPRDFLSYNLQKQIKSDTKAEESEQALHNVEKRLVSDFLKIVFVRKRMSLV